VRAGSPGCTAPFVVEEQQRTRMGHLTEGDCSASIAGARHTRSDTVGEALESMAASPRAVRRPTALLVATAAAAVVGR
jgi:hypothetical protein